jgi:hypothetical protein
MPGSSNHNGLVPRASNTRRGEHPDIDPASGDVKWEASLPPDRREFLELWNDPVRKAMFMDGVAQRQSREHPDTQEAVAGRYYDGNGDPLTAYQQYQSDLSWARQYTGHDKELTSYDVANMDLDTYNRHFDANGRPKDGFTFRTTSRDIVADDQVVDKFSRTENELRARDRR